ncbi:hypothetical protein LMED105_02038 [Limnobacter sp. MED105]|nr:hypothetical protein LMED105_02038 [Limnobacter sp. MED105]
MLAYSLRLFTSFACLLAHQNRLAKKKWACKPTSFETPFLEWALRQPQRITETAFIFK